MDLNTKRSLLKRAISPSLEDEVTSIMEKVARTAVPADDLNDYPKRWLTVGICLHTVISPVLREYILPILIKLYYRLTRIYKIDNQSYPSHLKKYLRTFLNYEMINKNKDNFGKWTNRYDYRVKNPVDLSKLFLQTHMVKYQGIDDSCDSSALLGIIICIDEFPVSVRSHAEMIRSNIRNPWAHCNLQEWDKGKFATSFTDMGNFISSLGLKTSVKQSTLDEITKWETNDTKFLKGTVLGLELVKEIRQETCILAKYANILKFNLESEIEKRAAADKVIQDEVMTLNEKIKDINQRQEEIIPKYIRDFHEYKIRGWEKDDETFVETRATEHVMSWLLTSNIAVITGSSGTGKSFLIHHVALELHRQNKYDIIPLSFLTAPSDIMKYISKNRHQVFVIDDICGKGTMDVQLINTWKDQTENINDIFKSDCTRTKLLISCRLQVFNDSQFKGLTRFTANVFDIVSEPLCLLPEERLLMIEKYLETDKVDLVINDLCHFDFFPLLCKMSKNISYEELPLFFKAPIDTIKQRIKQILDSENRHQSCALVLSILFEYGFKENWIKYSSKAAPDMKTVKLREITRHCDIDLQSDSARRSLQNGFATLEGTFLEKNGTKYIIHDKIYDIAYLVCGQYYEECFIKYANQVAIGDLYAFRSIETDPTDEFIVLPEEIEESYFERLVDDLKQCNIYSTIHNNQLVHESFRKKLISYLQHNAEDLKKYSVKSTLMG